MALHETLALYGAELPGVPAIDLLKTMFNLRGAVCAQLADRFASLHGLCHETTVADLRLLDVRARKRNGFSWLWSSAVHASPATTVPVTGVSGNWGC